MTIDTNKIEQLLRDVTAEHILPRFQSLQDEEVMRKTGATDLVTVADIEAEAALDQILPDLYPGSIVIGEESISRGDKDIDDLNTVGGIIWVVDPVDGTYNFVHGKDEFCIMLACVVDGVVKHGWIYDIPGDRMLSAEKGEGVSIDGSSITLSSKSSKTFNLKETRGFAGQKYFPSPVRPHLQDFAEQVTDLRTLSCAGHEYLRLMTSDAEFSIYSKTRPWDHLAGTLCFQEAGGVSKKWDGSQYMPGDDRAGLMNALSAELWDEIHKGVVTDMLEAYRRAS